MYSAITAATTVAPLHYSQEVRAIKRVRHFFEEGQDLFQSKSPKLKVAASEATINTLRYKAALREQKATIERQDSDFIGELFAAGNPHDIFLEATGQ